MERPVVVGVSEGKGEMQVRWLQRCVSEDSAFWRFKGRVRGRSKSGLEEEGVVERC